MEKVVNCVLSTYCKEYNTVHCNKGCSAFIGFHGLSGKSGRSKDMLVPHEFSFSTLENYGLEESHPEIYKMLSVYKETFKRQFEDLEHTTKNKVKSLYFYSKSPGTGKSNAAAALVNEYAITNFIGAVMNGKQPAQAPCLFLDMNEFQKLYNNFNRPNVDKEVGAEASAEYYKLLKRAQKTNLLVFDDVGLRTVTEGLRGDIHSIINYRVANNLPSIYTSNLPLEDLMTTLSPQLYDRIRDLTMVVPFTGKSHRGKRLT